MSVGRIEAESRFGVGTSGGEFATTVLDHSSVGPGTSVIGFRFDGFVQERKRAFVIADLYEKCGKIDHPVLAGDAFRTRYGNSAFEQAAGFLVVAKTGLDETVGFKSIGQIGIDAECGPQFRSGQIDFALREILASNIGMGAGAAGYSAYGRRKQGVVATPIGVAHEAASAEDEHENSE